MPNFAFFLGYIALIVPHIPNCDAAIGETIDEEELIIGVAFDDVVMNSTREESQLG